MGTNFYIQTKNKKLAEKYAPYSYTLTDTPDWGYRIHVAKTSMGWLPLFEAHDYGIQSVAQYKEAYDTGEFIILNEYDEQYTWDDFVERVLKFNGGVLGRVKPTKVKPLTKEQTKICGSIFDDNMPEYIPITHTAGTKQSYKYNDKNWNDNIFIDPEGYEFTHGDFC